MALRNKISRQTLSKRFSVYLNNPPKAKTYFKKLIKKKIKFSGFLLIDGSWFGRKRCLVLYKDSIGGIVYWRFSNNEYLSEIKSDLEFLINNAYPLLGAISDGKSGIVRAVESLGIPAQRCLVHLQMAVQRSTTKKPKTIAGKDLLLWSKILNQITNNYEAKILISWFKRLHLRHKGFLNEKSYKINPITGKKHWWYTHKYLRAGYKAIINALPSMFTYLKIPSMPKDNNGIEGFFSQLENKSARHRGFKQTRRENFISWMFWLRKFKQKP